MSTDQPSSATPPTISFLTPSPTSKERKIWSYAETTSLIAFRYEPETRAKFDTMKRNKYLWEEVAEKMRKAGHQRNAVQCSVRWKNLMAAFKNSYAQEKTQAEHPGEASAPKRRCSFYRELEAALTGQDLRNLDNATSPTSTKEDIDARMAASVVGLPFTTHPEGPDDDGLSAPMDTSRAPVPEERTTQPAETVVHPRSHELDHIEAPLVGPPPTMHMGSASVSETMLVEVVGKLREELTRQRKQFEAFEKKFDTSVLGQAKDSKSEERFDISVLGKRMRPEEGDQHRQLHQPTNQQPVIPEEPQASMTMGNSGAAETMLVEVISQLREELCKQRKQFESFERRSAKLEGLLSLLMEKVDTLGATVDKSVTKGR